MAGGTPVKRPPAAGVSGTTNEVAVRHGDRGEPRPAGNVSMRRVCTPAGESDRQSPVGSGGWERSALAARLPVVADRPCSSLGVALARHGGFPRVGWGPGAWSISRVSGRPVPLPPKQLPSGDQPVRG